MTGSPRILIILMGSLGDVARGLALPAEIKKFWQGAEISWLVEPACRAVVELNRYIDRVIVYNRPRHILAAAETIRELRKEKYDYVFDLQRHLKSGLFSFLSGGKKRIGFHPKNSKEFNYLFNNCYIETLSPTAPKLDHYLAFLKAIGISGGADSLDFGLSHIKELPAQVELLGKLPGRFASLVLGSSWESKDWPVSGYAALIKELLSENQNDVVLLGDKTQVDRAAELERHFSSTRIRNFAGRTSLADLIALIDQSLYIVGPDSGPGHLAGALGTPYISLFGPTDPRITAPYGSEDLAIQSSLGCIPCYRRRCPGLNKLCMRLITPKSVLQKLREIRSP